MTFFLSINDKRSQTVVRALPSGGTLVVLGGGVAVVDDEIGVVALESDEVVVVPQTPSLVVTPTTPVVVSTPVTPAVVVTSTPQDTVKPIC